MLVWEKFSSFFHESWHIKMQKFIESEECEKIYANLRAEKDRIFPIPSQTWRAFQNCDYNHLRCIIVGQSPYHTTHNNKIIADGLAFSTSNTNHETPSLKLFLDGMQDDLGKEIERNTDFGYLAQQNVLLINTSLTVKAQKGDSHMELWQPFIKYLFTEILDTVTGVPIILVGKTAKTQVEKYLFPMSQPYKCVDHPAYYARLQQPWKHENMFTWASRIIEENRGEKIWWDYADWEKYGLPF